MPCPLPLRALNHISIVVADVEAVAFFYRDVLGFELIKRPRALEEDFHGAWLHNYNIGVHLIQGKPLQRPAEINIKDDHLSFMSDNLADVEQRLAANTIAYKKNVFIEEGCLVSQLFFHDPEHHMIEICNCEILPVCPIAQLSPPAVRQSHRPSASDTSIASPASSDGAEWEVSSAAETASERRDSHDMASTSPMEQCLAAADEVHQRLEDSLDEQCRAIRAALAETGGAQPPQQAGWACSLATLDASQAVVAAGVGNLGIA